MKVCILKQPYVTEFTWSTHCWTSPHNLLNNFVHRSQNFGLVCETQADVWVVEDGDFVSDTYTYLLLKAPDAVESLYKSHTTVSWADVPWDQYDVVISLDQIVPDHLIVQYPQILWCYYEQEHAMASFQSSVNHPYGKYDLFLNHALSCTHFTAQGLPLSINFPYLCSRKAFDQVISVEKCDRIFLDSHCIRGVADLEEFRNELEQKFGIEVTHTQLWDYINSYRSVGEKKPSTTRQFLNNLAACKYFLLNRGGLLQIGQSAPEAAALGVIVLADKMQIYAHYLCHPETWVEPRDYDSAAKVIKKITANLDLQQEIVKYQFEKVQKFFLDYPLELLERCLEIKRGAKTTYVSFPSISSKSMWEEVQQRNSLFNSTRRYDRVASSQVANKSLFTKTTVNALKQIAVFELKSKLPNPIKTKLVNFKKKIVANKVISQDHLERCQTLSVICTGRNDQYASNFKERMFAAIERNQTEAANKNLKIEWIFVEWNPVTEDYLSYQLAEKGFKCYVVSPAIHQQIISPRVAERVSFLQFFAKNVGIRRATGDWILVTNADCIFDNHIWEYIANKSLSSHLLYRAERCDVNSAYFNRPFEFIRANISRCHSVQGGKDFAQGSGDFVLFSSSHRIGYDERVNFSDAHVDARFCMNWSALKSGTGDIQNHYFFRFIGQVFKADHDLVFVKTYNLSRHHKGWANWTSTTRIKDGIPLYENDDTWGLANKPEKKLGENIWYIG